MPKGSVLRLVLLNLCDIVLQTFSVEEARFVRKPTQLFGCFLNSNESRSQRRENQIQELLNGVSFKSQHKKAQVGDPEYRYLY